MQRNTIDLHTHSRASDGSMSPRELVKHAKDCGLAAIALTDHDTMDGVKDAIDEGKRLGIEVIAGVEISVEYDCEMHMLGYFFNESYGGMVSVFRELLERRHERNPKIVSKLREFGFDITMEEVEKGAGGSIVGRPHIAKVMLNKGFVSSIREAFDKYLAAGRPAYFKKDKLTPGEGIKEILKSGGVPVLAHPRYLGLGEDKLDQLFANMRSLGLKGVEAYYVDNTPEETKLITGLAVKNGLLLTGGSDFHGRFKPDIEIGKGYGNLSIPYELLEGLRNSVQ